MTITPIRSDLEPMEAAPRPYEIEYDDRVGMPYWWLKRLYGKVLDCRGEYDFFEAYYIGDHPLPWLAPQARSEFRRLIKMTRTNYMGLVCRAPMQRTNIEGFRFGDNAAGDKESWDIWQANNLDADAGVAFLESLIAGRAFWMVDRNRRDPSKPLITVEDATQCYVEYEPGTNRRVRKAGIKVWTDDWTGMLCATVFVMYPMTATRDELFVFKYEAALTRSEGYSAAERIEMGRNPNWVKREVTGETWGASGGLDRLPIIEIPNNPRLRRSGVSELEDITDIQDRINKTVADRLVTQDYGSFPQKWAIGWPDEDEQGNPNTVDIGRNRMVTSNVAETRFGQFDAAPLDPYSLAKREDVKDIAAMKQVPAQYLLGDMSNVNGETLKASESGHIASTKQKHKPWGESAEEAMRVARILAGLSTEGMESMETIFANPEFRTEGELTDATVKKLQAGIATRRQARVDVGYSETTIRNMEKDDINEAVPPALAQALRGVRQPDGTTSPPLSG